MTIPEILKELELYTGNFPKKAMEAAIEQRDGITPELLKVVESVAEAPTEFANREDNMLPLFTIFLLAQFREQRAYMPIVKMFSAPGETSFELTATIRAPVAATRNSRNAAATRHQKAETFLFPRQIRLLGTSC